MTYYVTFDERQHDRQFLFHLLSILDLPGMAKGVKPGLNRNDVYAARVRIPPLPEQQRIVSILDEAFAGIATARANAQTNLENARALFASHLEALIAHAWAESETVTLESIATDITDGDHMPPPKSDTGVPFITIGNINKATRTIDFRNTFMVPERYFHALKPSKRPRKGDVLYTVTGSFGIPVLINEEEPFCFQRHIGLIRPSEDTDSTWLYFLLSSPQVFRQADAKATGAAQRTVSLKVLRNIKVPKVKRTRQEVLAKRLGDVLHQSQRLEAMYLRKLEALDALKQSLLHQAFSGAL